MRRPRLRRLDEVYQDQPLIFVTFCIEGRKKFLARADVHESFRTFCRNASEQNNLVGRYVIMPDHIHFFVQMHTVPLLSTWIKSLKNTLSKTLRLWGTPGPHWQMDFFDHILRSEESYGSKWDYVAQNPVRAGLVLEAEQWPYQGEVVPLSFL